MSLTRIPTDVEKKICALSDIKSFTKAVEELVYNAFDAKSTSIAIRVFIQEGSIQVIDNGCGILAEDFKFLGLRYYTSKYRSESELYGYRGSTLASIVEVSKIVKITSRYRDENTDCTYTKTFLEGKERDIIEASTRPSKGTTVDVTGFLHNCHIQKGNTNATNEISRIKAFLERLSLVHCNTSMSLRDDSTNEIVFQINKHRDIPQTLQTLYQITQQDIQELQVEKNDYKIQGFIEKAIGGENNCHFIFVNDRFVRNSKLQSSIDTRLKSNNNDIITKRKSVFDNTEKIRKKNLPFYFIFIKCPHQDYNINQNNEETFIEFKNWDNVEKLAEKLIKFYKGDLNVKEIKNNCNKNSNNVNGDTQNQVRKIIQKFLNNSSKRPKRLRLKTGVIGKNATRKDIKKSENLSISKIVSKQFRSRFNKFYNNNPPKNKNDLTSSRWLSIESNKETDLKTVNKVIERREEVNSDILLKQNKVKQRNIKPSHTQDSLSKRFKNPSNTILKRCDMLFEGGKEYLDSGKAIDNIEWVRCKTMQTEFDARFVSHCVTHKQSRIKSSHDLIQTVLDCGEVFDHIISKCGKNNEKKMVKNFARKKVTVRKSSHNVEYSEASPSSKRKKYITERSYSDCHTSKKLYSVFRTNDKNKKDIRKNKFRERLKNEYNVKGLSHKNVYTEQTIHTIETFESHIRNKVGYNIKSLGDKSYISHRGHRVMHGTLSSKVKTCNAREVITSNKGKATIYDFHNTYTINISQSNNHYSREDQFLKDSNNVFPDVTCGNIFCESDYLFLNNPTTTIASGLQNSSFVNNVLTETLCENAPIKYNTDLSSKYYNDVGHIQHSLIEGNKSALSDYNIIKNNKNIGETEKVYVEEQHQSMNPLDICETMFQDSTDENIFFESNFNDNVIISSKEFSPKQKSYGCIIHRSIKCNENNSPRLDHTKIIQNTNVNESVKVILQEQLDTTTLVSSEGKTDKMININEIGKLSDQYENLIVATLKKSAYKVNTNRDLSISTQGFQLNSRRSFIPKGMSQIVQLQNQKVLKFQNQQVSEFEELNYYDTDVYDNFATNLQTVSEILEPGVQVLNNLDKDGMRLVKPCSNDPIFDDQSLKEVKVIGQVDNKFIGAKVTGRYSRINITSEFLVLFDQHAVDERISLENNMADYFDGVVWNSVPIGTVSIKLPKDIITYLHNYKEKFTRFGLEWTCNDDVVSVKAIPKAIFGKRSRQIDVIIKAVKSLISEEVEAIKSLKGNVCLHPISIMDLVLSEACRYAIKFGDVLSKSECEDLLKALSTCKLPFQCAHGRPVMAVMMELPSKSYEYKINMECVKHMKLKLGTYLN